jgi:AcrR family transcriptional regulator
MTGARAAAGGRRRTPSTHLTEELLKAAEFLLVRDGLAGLTVRAVAAEAGAAPMGVYSRLGGKIGLVSALLARGFDRLRAAIDLSGELGPQAGDPSAMLRDCLLRYREFALENPELYVIMFGRTIQKASGTAQVRERAADCFWTLARHVELAAAANMLAAPDHREAAQQIWSALHGAVSLELSGLAQTSDPVATYSAFLDTMLRGLFRQPSSDN